MRTDEVIVSMDEKKKYLYMECLRIIACLFVIFNHTNINGFFLFSKYSKVTWQFWVYLFISIFCKFAVPLFFAISGALLLVKKESLEDLWKKRILKIVTVLIVFSFLFYIRELQLTNQRFSLFKFVENLCVAEWNYSYWYLYLFIPYLIGLPFLRTLVNNLEDKYFYYLFLLAILNNAIWPIVEYLIFKGEKYFNSFLRINWLTNSIVLYPCWGYFMQYRIDIEKIRKLLPALWGLNIVTIIISAGMTYYRAVITGVCDESNSQMFHSSFVLINVTAIFLTVKYYFSIKKVSAIVEKIIISLGNCTFGIYILHVMILSKTRRFSNLWNFFKTQWHINDMISAFLICFIVMIICYLLTLILKRIPIIRKLI